MRDQHGGSVMLGCPRRRHVEGDGVHGYPRSQEEARTDPCLTEVRAQGRRVQIFLDFARGETQPALGALRASVSSSAKQSTASFRVIMTMELAAA